MTPQQKIKAKLEGLGIPAKDIHCYGSQVMITCWGRESAEKFYRVLTRFCGTVRGPQEAFDDNLKNKNTVMRPSHHKVWRVWGTI